MITQLQCRSSASLLSPPANLHDALTPTSVVDVMINRAKLLAGTNPQFFSHSIVLALTTVEKVTVLLRADTNTAGVRVRALNCKELVTQFLFCQDGLILLFTSPIVETTAANLPIVLGSMLDIIDTTIPVSISACSTTSRG
jgi:hypothetical protein